jgi:hypothetical protein
MSNYVAPGYVLSGYVLSNSEYVPSNIRFNSDPRTSNIAIKVDPRTIILSNPSRSAAVFNI